MRDMKVAISKGAQYHIPDAVARLIGPRNIAKVEINGIKTRGLMDSGSQVNMMTDRFLTKLGLTVRPLADLGLYLGVEGSAGTDIPYIGYIEQNLKLPAANNYDSNQLFLVVEQCTKFGDQVPVQVGTNFQDKLLAVLPVQDLVGLVKEVKRGNSMQNSFTSCSNVCRGISKEVTKQLEKAKKEIEWDLESLKGKIRLTKAVTIPAKGELQVTGVTTVKGHTKRCHVIVEPYGEKQERCNMTPVYTDLKPGSSKVKMHVTNASNKLVQLPATMVIGAISAANVIPAMIAPKNMLEEGWDQPPEESKGAENEKAKKLGERGKLVVEWLYLSSIQNWNKGLKQQVNELLVEFQDIFALSDLEFGKTNLVMHHIPVTNPVPFKERHTRIPPSQF